MRFKRLYKKVSIVTIWEIQKERSCNILSQPPIVYLHTTMCHPVFGAESSYTFWHTSGILYFALPTHLNPPPFPAPFENRD